MQAHRSKQYVALLSMLASLQTQLAMMHKELMQEYATLAVDNHSAHTRMSQQLCIKAVALIIHSQTVSLAVTEAWKMLQLRLDCMGNLQHGMHGTHSLTWVVAAGSSEVVSSRSTGGIPKPSEGRSSTLRSISHCRGSCSQCTCPCITRSKHSAMLTVTYSGSVGCIARLGPVCSSIVHSLAVTRAHLWCTLMWRCTVCICTTPASSEAVSSCVCEIHCGC